MANSNTHVDNTLSGEAARLTFPCLDDSPLWNDSFEPPREPQKKATPPLLVIRAHYPRIARAIELMWGHEELNAYFTRLIINDRGTRAGFPKEVMAALLSLSADHRKRFRFDDNAAADWSMDPYQKHIYRG